MLHKHLVVILLFIQLLSSYECQNATIILPALNKTQFDVGLIFIQGSQIPSQNYVKSLRILQEKYLDNLWVAIPEFLYDLPDSTQINAIMNQSYSALKQAGCNIDPQMPFIFGAHSLGSKVLQDYLFANDTYKHLPVNLTGVILNGAFYNRNYRNRIGKSFVPVFTLGGELDGWNRITRVTESLYYDYFLQTTPDNSYTVIIQGMNHYQFVGDGTPPSYLDFNDIQPEINDSMATDMVTTFMKSFIKISLCSQYTDCFDEKISIAYAVSQSLFLVRPILDAFQYEGYYYLENPPCYSIPEANRTAANCTLGSAWTGYMQQILGTYGDAVPNITNTDTFQRFNDILIKRPKLHNSCITGNTSCQLNITTYTQTDYFIEYGPDSEDESFNMVAPYELRAEMISRQAIVYALTGKKLDFNETDGGSFCAYLNNFTINWALKECPSNTLERYLAKGMPLIPGPDIESYDSQLVWMWNPLLYTHIFPDESSNKTYYMLQAPMLKASLDSPIEWIRGFHYCKLLSPSRALEWIYLDSLKQIPYP